MKILKLLYLSLSNVFIIKISTTNAILWLNFSTLLELEMNVSALKGSSKKTVPLSKLVTQL